MSIFTLKTIVITLLLTFVQHLQAEGFRRGTIYIQPAIAEAEDDSLQLRKRIKKDMMFAKHIYSQIGISVKTSDIIVLNLKKKISEITGSGARVTALEDLWKVKLPTFKQDGHLAVPVIYVPPIAPYGYGDENRLSINGTVRGNTVPSVGSFISIKLPENILKSSAIYPDTAAHEVLHFLLGENYSFGNESYSWYYHSPTIEALFILLGYDYPLFSLDEHHSRNRNDLLAKGDKRNAPRALKECAPLGRKAQIRNIEIFKNGQLRKLVDVLFENTKYVEVEHCEQCNASLLDSGRILYQYPDWLPEPETFMKFYGEDLSAKGRIAIKTDEDNQAKATSKSTLPVVLRYTDLGQETQNGGGAVFGAQIQSKEPVVFNEPVSELSASIMIEDMTNFSNSRADGVIVLNANISPSIFSKTHPLEKSAIDRTARALQNNGRHELEITFSDLRLALPETLKDFSIVASGRGVSKEGIEYEVLPDPASGPDRMTIKLRVKQQVGTNKPDFGKLSLRINSKFLLTKGAIPTGQLLDLFKAWYSK